MFKTIIQRILNRIAFIIPGGYTIRPSLHRMRGAVIGKNVWISQYVYIDELHPEEVTINDNCTIGLRATIFTHFYWGRKRTETNKGKVIIGKDVFIGPHCVILPGVHIGEGAVVKAGTVVARNIPPHALYGYPSPVVLGTVTVPLTPQHTYEDFVSGLRPVGRRVRGKTGEKEV